MRTLGYLAIALFLVTPSLAIAQSYKAGDRVVVISKSASLTRGERIVDKVKAGQTLVVRQVRDELIRVAAPATEWRTANPQSGWMKTNNVLPFEKAVEHFSTLVDQNPDDGTWLEARANARRQNDEIGLAVLDYSNLVKKFPDVAAYVSGMGRAWEDMDTVEKDGTAEKHRTFEKDGTVEKSGGGAGPIARATANYRRAIELDPEFAAAYTNLGALLTKTRQFDDALKHFDEVIRLEPSSAAAYLNRANVWLELEKFDKCIEDSNKAIELDPMYADAYHRRGVAYYQQGNDKLALEDLGEAIRTDPGNDYHHYTRGYIYYENREYDKAISDLSESIQLNPKQKPVYRYLAQAWDQKGNGSQAMAVRSALINLDPTDPEPFVHRGAVWLGRNEYDRAIDDFARAIRVDPDNFNALYLRASAFRKSREFDKAVKSFSIAIAAYPKEGRLYNDRGLTLRKQGEYAKALADFDKAISIQPHIVAAHTNAAYIYASCPVASLRDGERAIVFAKNSLAISGFENFYSLSALAAAYAEMGKFELAVKTQRRAINGIAETEERTEVPEAEKVAARSRLRLYQARKPYRETPAR